MVALSGTLAALASAAIDESRVLLVVNSASAVSRQTARIYRQYHPGIPDQHVVYLTGLADVRTPAGEIITRGDFEAKIAQPIRQHLIQNSLADYIWVIVTTAGMPYRIADTTLTGVVYPAGSDPILVQNNQHLVDAASVESELAVLFQIDPALDRPQRAPLAARIVNPYHGYISPFEAFAAQRDILGRRTQFNFQAPPGASSVVYEGTQWSAVRATGGRTFSASDIYLVARLDGPRTATMLPLGAIRRMLESASRVGNVNNRCFRGYSPGFSAAALDDSDGLDLDLNRWLNAGKALPLSTPPDEYLTAELYPTPPNVGGDGSARDDVRFAHRSLTGSDGLPDPNGPDVLISLIGDDLLGGLVAYDPTALVLSQADLPQSVAAIALATFGTNAEDGRTKYYLLTGGPGGSRVLNPAYGAVFNSLESFNAVTFFVDAPTTQAKLVDWLTIGGSGAAGHAFEPISSAAVDNDLLLYNYLRDWDGDGVGDLTFVEAAYTAMPFLSWANVVVGDPLMVLRQGPDTGPALGPPVVPGDADWNGYVSTYDYLLWALAYGSQVGDDRYDDRADFNQDGWVSTYDYLLWALHYGYAWQPTASK
jgi:hypothetical protein